MAARDLSSLPIHLATRLVLDSILYSSPLPPWRDTITINYALREETIRTKITQYLDGGRPKAPFEILVPNKRGTNKTWIIPSVNDQIVLQSVVSALAKKVNTAVDTECVLSYRYNTDPNRLQLIDSQISAWSLFQDETRRRLRVRPFLLQLDLEQAFRSINRARFIEFVEDLSPNPVEVQLLKVLLESFEASNQGLPLINDSLFFLGNAFLSIVDNKIKKHSVDFIRFVDDYRVFGESQDSLEQILAKINQELRQIGFKLNMSKVKLGSAEEYFEALANSKYAKTEALANSEYISAAIFDDIIDPKQMVELVARVVANPDQYLNEGFGRLLLGAIRRMRLNDILATWKNYPYSPLSEYTELLSKNKEVVDNMKDLLQKYAQSSGEAWRTIWLMFVINDMNLVDPRGGQMKETVKAIGTGNNVPLVVQLWAKKLWPLHSSIGDGDVEDLHDLSYLEAGIRLHGGTPRA